jgi:anaerobic carbon-monoxide dehydrogenase iron sulfur subunit
LNGHHPTRSGLNGIRRVTMKRVLVRPDRCLGCRSCEMACVDHHMGVGDDRRSAPSPVPRIKVEPGPAERSRSSSGQEDSHHGPYLRTSSVVLCLHCDDPECVGACTAGALTKDPDGVVRLDPELCVGCLICIDACPHGAISHDASANIVVKCDLCPGKEVPACVEACVVDALFMEQDRS